MAAGVVRIVTRIPKGGMVASMALTTGLAVALLATAARSETSIMEACFGEDAKRRIEGCSELLAVPDLNSSDKSLAHAMRGLAYSLEGRYAEALPDYDIAIRLDPYSSIALNNRAWTLFKAGQPGKGFADVQRALELSPDSPHALDTRAHIHQSLGRTASALEDYTRAMQVGGPHIVKLYQCGLKAEGLLQGEADGVLTPEVMKALETCVQSSACDPLPPGDDCNYTTS